MYCSPQDIPSGGQGSDNAVRRLLDGVGSVAEVVSSVSAFPAKAVTSWMSDKIAPTYWTPNSKILVCKKLYLFQLSNHLIQTPEIYFQW